MPMEISPQDTYSSWVGLMYVFNLIVGTGALTLPSVFTKAGWLLSLILIMLLAFVSFVTVTFIIETLACSNATLLWRRIQSHKIDGESEATATDSDQSDEQDMSNVNEQTAIINHNRSRGRYYSLNQKIELGEMAGLYFNRVGRILFFLSLCIYLYGDLAIYTAAISKTLCDMICSSGSNRTSDDFVVPCFQPKRNNTQNLTSYDYYYDYNLSSTTPVLLDQTDSAVPTPVTEGMSKLAVYRLFILAFALIIGPFSYFNVQKTKYFQMATTTMRWCAFSIMITLAAIRLIRGADEIGEPVPFRVHGVPALIGASVYSFMCHHSLPGLIAPFVEKTYIIKQIALDYFLICSFYLLLGLTGSFAFRDLYDLYTLNFVPTEDDESNVALEIILYFLGLFPVFTLSTSFPIIAITLQNNLKALFLDINAIDRYNFVLRRLTFPTVAILPPILVAFLTHDLSKLVEFTGSYAGACIQYVIPACLVWQARQHCKRDIGCGAINKYRSPFNGFCWIVFVLAWCGTCIIMVTVNLFWDE